MFHLKERKNCLVNLPTAIKFLHQQYFLSFHSECSLHYNKKNLTNVHYYIAMLYAISVMKRKNNLWKHEMRQYYTYIPIPYTEFQSTPWKLDISTLAKL